MSDLTPMYTSGQLVVVSPERAGIPAETLFVARIKNAVQLPRYVAGTFPIVYEIVFAYELERVEAGQIDPIASKYAYQDEIIGYVVKPSEELRDS